ncbi:3367_t:CDS:2 [Cetraspora pellucida]|uniref:3367_t:CDS:1 n=1 Tax=Cetraspora pellucida TaxID=1433469 RepID=A0A9N9G802_9GLOM|nr:3367_t:CDS:2 [Cetraspora pellucida]
MICFVYQYLLSGLESIYLEDGFEVNVLGFDSMSYGYPPYRNYRKYGRVNCDDADTADPDSLKYYDSEQWYDDYYSLHDSIFV